jgi:DNA repair exonuclease SbcCD ATPase subunit
MAIIINRAGIEGTGIKPDSPQWVEWFTTQPEGVKIQFVWTDDSFREQKFTAYRRKRYWEAQKRISGKLRNTTIKPGEVTYEALRQMGLRLTSYNWADKFEHEESGNNNQTLSDQSSQTRDEVEELKSRLAGLEAQLKKKDGDMAEASRKIELIEKESRDLKYRYSDLERENARLERLGTDYSHQSFITLTKKYQKALEDAKHWEEVAGSYSRQAEAIAKKREEAEDEIEKLEAKLSEAVARIAELEPLQLRISGMEDTMRHMHNELLTRPHPADLIRRKVSELGMQGKIMQHQSDPKTNARYWALAKLLEALE